MADETLWAPWRLPYIKEPKEATPGCFLCHCRDADHSADRENLLVARGAHTLTVLNRFPYNNGHLLICPREHSGELTDLSDEVLLACQQELRRMVELLTQRMNAQGFNIGLNLGRVAGAGLPGHLHWHIVPRWAGDTNFMPVVGDTKVIPQSLDALYDLLTQDS